mmetsp:Transcript_106227/g.317383  ORF Transcript_106227/g.317383 Transcript_106227/m.317383 type:complete len:234 (+) Transcript_106227:295-996(+)
MPRRRDRRAVSGEIRSVPQPRLQLKMVDSTVATGSQTAAHPRGQVVLSHPSALKARTPIHPMLVVTTPLSVKKKRNSRGVSEGSTSLKTTMYTLANSATMSVSKSPCSGAAPAAPFEASPSVASTAPPTAAISSGRARSRYRVPSTRYESAAIKSEVSCSRAIAEDVEVNLSATIKATFAPRARGARTKAQRSCCRSIRAASARDGVPKQKSPSTENNASKTSWMYCRVKAAA